MPAAESTIVFLPRFTTLIGAGEATTQPLDVSQFASAQFQVGCGAKPTPQQDPGDVAFAVYLEESLDCVHWSLGASAPKPYDVRWTKVRLFSYGFRLRWFRLRIVPVAYSAFTCWAEGILR